MSHVELNYSEVETLINEISTGGKVKFIKNKLNDKVPLFIRYCSLAERMNSDLEYEKAYAKAIDDGFFTAEQAQAEMRKRGFFTEEDEQNLEKLYKQKDAQEQVLQRTTRVPVRRSRLVKIIEDIDNRINVLLNKRERGMEFSAERRAQEAKYLYLTWMGTLTPYDRKQYWTTKEEFDNETDIDLRTNALVEVVKMSLGMKVSVLRYIARNSLWRIRYITSMKTNISLFGRELPEYTVDQFALVYWSNYYQSVYDMLPSDRPPDTIIEDDAALDAYMKSFIDEQSKEAASARMQKRGNAGLSAWDHGDVLVMRSNPHYYDVEEYADTSKLLNDSSSIDVKEKDNKTSRERRTIRNRRRKLRENLR